MVAFNVTKGNDKIKDIDEEVCNCESDNLLGSKHIASL
jgi:hypothetical protein